MKHFKTLLLALVSITAFAVTTTNMSLDLPVPGSTTGPLWATKLNTALTTVDAHDHTTGKGAKVPVAGLNINTDLPMGGFNVNSANSYRLISQSGALAGASDIRSLYSVSGDLYYNNASGTAVKLTSGSALNIASLGTIGGDYGGSNPASVFYTDSTKTYSFTQSAGKTAKVALGDLSIFENAVGAQGITIKSPTSLGSSYSLTLPTATPAANTVLKSTTSGVLSFGTIGSAEITDASIVSGDIATNTIANTNIRQSAAVSVVGNSTNSTANVADVAASSNDTVLMRKSNALSFDGVDTAQIKDSAVTTVKIAAANVSRVKLDSDSNLGLAKAWANFNTIPLAGTYGRSSNLITIAMTAHGMSTGQKANLTFSAGTGGTATSGTYAITNINANSFAVTDLSSGTITGSPAVTRNNYIYSSYNVSSITDNGSSGDFTLNWTNAMADANYCPVMSGAYTDDSGSTRSGVVMLDLTNILISASQLRILTKGTATTSSNGSQQDMQYVSVAIYGN